MKEVSKALSMACLVYCFELTVSSAGASHECINIFYQHRFPLMWTTEAEQSEDGVQRDFKIDLTPNKSEGNKKRILGSEGDTIF